MPQIQVLPEVQGFGSQLGEALGGGLGAGIQQGVQQGISNRINSMLQTKKELGKVRTSTNSLLRRYEKGTFDPDTINSFEKRAADFVNSGLSADDASMLAVEEFNFKRQQEEAAKPKKPGFFKELASKLGGREETIGALKGLGQDIKGAAQKFAYPFVGQAEMVKEAFSPNAAAELDMLQQGFTPEQIAQGRQEVQSQLPFFLRQEGERKPLTESYLEATGGVGPGENKIERAIQGALGTFHPAGAVGSLASETAAELGAPPVVQAAADALGFVLALKGGAKLESNILKANNKVLSKAESIAAKSGQEVEEVIKAAQESSGANLEKALAGDVKEINKLNRAVSKEVPKVAEKVASTEKTVFNPKQAIKEREIFGAKLPESPFEAYYKIEAEKVAKQASKTPATLAKEAELTSRVKPLEEAKFNELQTQKQQLKDLESSVKTLEGSNKARVESTIGFKQREIQKTLDELKDLNYELKYFRKRPSEAEINSQIRKSGEELIAEARKPTEAGQKRLQKTLNADKEYIERAEKLISRGELPGELRPDTHIKMKQKYLDGYEAMIGELKESNKALRGARDVESLKTIADNKRAMNYLQGRQNRLKSDIVNQTDKIKAMKAVEGPSGAFYRQQLKGLRQDVEQFQHDFFKQPRVKQPTQMKAEKVVGKHFKSTAEAEKLGEQVAKTPTPENIKEAAEATNQSPKQVREEIDQLKTKMKERAEKVEAGKATEKDVQQAEKEIDKFFRVKRNIKTAGTHLLIGAATSIAEEELGMKIPRSYLYGASALLGKRTTAPGRAIGFTVGHSLVRYIYNKKEALKLRELRKNPNDYTSYIQSLRKRYSAKRVNEIIEDSK